MPINYNAAADAFNWVLRRGSGTGSARIIASVILSSYGKGKVDLSICKGLDEVRRRLFMDLVELSLQGKELHLLISDGEQNMNKVIQMYK